MRHINPEPGLLPQECSSDTSQQEEEGEEPHPWRRHHEVLMGCSPPELTCQKVYQVSIFSPLAGCSRPSEQRSPGRQPIKRACPEPQRAAEGTWDAKRGHWEGDDAIEDGLLVDELSLGGAAQHFSHSGLRVVEHRREGGPSATQAPHTPCDTLHTRDCAPALPGGGPMDCGPARRQEENRAQQDKGAASQTFLLDPDLHNLAHQSQPGQPPLVACGHTVPATPPAAQGSDTNGLGSAEKTPSASAQLPGGACPAKRKLLPSVEGAPDTGSEDESLPPARKKKRAPQCPPVPASCRSTDAKGAPFWNHLLPAAKGSGNSSAASCPLKTGLRLKQRHLHSSLRRSLVGSRLSTTPWATTSTSRALLGNFEESILKGRFPPSGRIEGFTAEIGASGSYCPQHATLPVEVTYFDIAEHSAPSPFLGVIDLEALGKKGYSIPKTGTIQVTLFNPNKTVVKMFLVTYDLHDMPANHITFLRHRIFLVPVGEEPGPSPAPGELPRRVLCYLMHLRFQSSKSGKIYLHDNIRLLFSRKSIEIDSGIPYELKSFTELPRNPRYSPRA
ncbi:atos homolog protein B [Rhineura floridana]|uniref:atos homolog protein B n=1 Tax=Rhineura floridana TaxID=261503 RepID=UPI002AC7EBC7|nr:atos homolog protein B [Rhineura floridana]XP_061468811.1 atos homolog protein B [Rhineura floridana]XP_061468818.1 atos homolog protein B [Rhineura floridana]XP_061468826.1 atos homolog protein B [Rhineura floridana]XP_061468835.1 atos homolog protein B [Rhineura floridana]XP_061468839.1 atos homolog protein B [Rhineura floridana]XP_061468845.1 atos homolog protein B [Rhineura floridana]